MVDPIIVTHLLDLLAKAPVDTFILGGGMGLQVKRAHLTSTGQSTLAMSVQRELPLARATSDFDLVLRIEVFTTPERGLALRSAIDELGFTERTPKMQFAKPYSENMKDQDLVLDLLARLPEEGESVEVNPPRVGSGSGTNLHGRSTAEAFAIEASPILCNVFKDGQVVGNVSVAHPFGLLNMKLRAAHDWHRFQEEPWPLRENQLPPSAKHAFDCALIIAMITEEERREAVQLAQDWRNHPIAAQIREEAVTLFGSRESPGWIAARQQGMFDDHDLIWSTMKDVLGVDI